MYRRKTPIKKDLEHLIYRPFWTSARKTCFFNGKFFCRVVKPTFSCPEEHLQSNVSERKSWKHKDFWINFEVFGTMAEKFFQGCQNSNRCPGEELFEKRFQKRKNHFFFDSERFFNLSEKICYKCETRKLRIRGKFLGKTFCENL